MNDRFAEVVKREELRPSLAAVCELWRLLGVPSEAARLRLSAGKSTHLGDLPPPTVAAIVSDLEAAWAAAAGAPFTDPRWAKAEHITPIRLRDGVELTLLRVTARFDFAGSIAIALGLLGRPAGAIKALAQLRRAVRRAHIEDLCRAAPVTFTVRAEVAAATSAKPEHFEQDSPAFPFEPLPPLRSCADYLAQLLRILDASLSSTRALPGVFLHPEWTIRFGSDTGKKGKYGGKAAEHVARYTTAVVCLLPLGGHEYYARWLEKTLAMGRDFAREAATLGLAPPAENAELEERLHAQLLVRLRWADLPECVGAPYGFLLNAIGWAVRDAVLALDLTKKVNPISFAGLAQPPPTEATLRRYIARGKRNDPTWIQGTRVGPDLLRVLEAHGVLPVQMVLYRLLSGESRSAIAAHRGMPLSDLVEFEWSYPGGLLPLGIELDFLLVKLADPSLLDALAMKAWEEARMRKVERVVAQQTRRLKPEDLTAARRADVRRRLRKALLAASGAANSNLATIGKLLGYTPRPPVGPMHVSLDDLLLDLEELVRKAEESLKRFLRGQRLEEMKAFDRQEYDSRWQRVVHPLLQRQRRLEAGLVGLPAPIAGVVAPPATSTLPTRLLAHLAHDELVTLAIALGATRRPRPADASLFARAYSDRSESDVGRIALEDWESGLQRGEVEASMVEVYAPDPHEVLTSNDSERVE